MPDKIDIQNKLKDILNTQVPERPAQLFINKAIRMCGLAVFLILIIIFIILISDKLVRTEGDTEQIYSSKEIQPEDNSKGFCLFMGCSPKQTIKKQ